MSKANNQSDIESMSFEQAMAELDQVVAKLESGNAPLEQSIDLYTRGTQLKAHCETLLAGAQAKIEKITFNEQKEPVGTTAFETDA